MPYTFVIDTERAVVVAVAAGVVTADELIDGTVAMGKAPGFAADMRLLVDFSQAVRVEIPTERLEELSEVSPYSSRSRRAYIVQRDFDFGLARMFSVFVEMHGKGEVQVFRSRPEAISWLNQGHPKEQWVV